jgi:hypothetical protein
MSFAVVASAARCHPQGRRGARRPKRQGGDAKNAYFEAVSRVPRFRRLRRTAARCGAVAVEFTWMIHHEICAAAAAC